MAKTRFFVLAKLGWQHNGNRLKRGYTSLSSFCVCTISLLSPPTSVFSLVQVRHL